MENNDWAQIINHPSDPYINSLLPGASYCSQYYNPPTMHPSEPNYLWLESGTNFGITTTGNPFRDHQSTTDHLTTYLNNAGITWRAYQEDISGTEVPLFDENNYAARHDPFTFFDDVTGTNNPNNAYGIAHIRPYTEFMGDLASNTVAQYNFITPNLCDDMHNNCAPLYNGQLQGDSWLSTEIPKITNSFAYKNNGAIFITWDEAGSADGPIGMIVLSPLAKGGGYVSTNHYTHSSTLRTMQEIFGVGPLLRDAANAQDLSDLFVQPQAITHYSSLGVRNFFHAPDGSVQFDVEGAIPGKTHVVQMSTDLVNWSNVCTNTPSTNSFYISDPSAIGASQRFYRVMQMP
ncbi:MAG TPA: alkaline phosphatase family protein [Verrucomicrobiae bacterium]|nr:alkaline phosphatase family protein [Verrucomicrobiae bacterium]